jgi:hypothetical protein
LIDGLKEEHAIIRSPELLGELVSMKNIPIDTVALAAAGNSDVESIRQWPLIHQLALRCLQIVQNDNGVRDARFYVTFVNGVDVLAMWVLCWFVLCSLYFRWKRAKSELSVLDDDTKADLSALLETLKAGDFKDVKKSLKALQRRAAPIFQEMLDIVKNELEIRGNDSQPDALLIRSNSLREEVASSRWLLAWCGRALPTVGFIFKVYGIALAMKSSDTIALASASLDQAAAISNVSGSLGLAFSATFVAFVLSLLVGFVEACEAHYERSVIAALESSLIPLLTVPPEPAPLTGTQKKNG